MGRLSPAARLAGCGCCSTAQRAVAQDFFHHMMTFNVACTWWSAKRLLDADVTFGVAFPEFGQIT